MPATKHEPKTFSLNGDWSLSFTHPVTGEHHCFPATVPGNVELDLQRAGIIGDFQPPDDCFAMRDFERVDDWTLSTKFDRPDLPAGHALDLVFEGIDTIADVTLNGEQILRCENMLIPHSADVSGLLKAKGNEVTVRIYSPELFARQFPYNAFSVYRYFRQAQAYLRKAPHMWGWDNAPRLLSAGIWRPVYLAVRPPIRFSEVYAYTQRVCRDRAWIGVNWAIETPDADLSGYRGRMILASGGQAEHMFDFEVCFTYGVLERSLETSSLKLWWPRGYGEPNLYDLSLQLFKDDELVAERTERFGIRELELERTEFIDENNEGEFVFRCNGEKIYINGTNWKPLDSLHSRAEEKVRDALDLCLDLNCNMVRIWGGGVYEGQDFFDYCDEHGLLVWQDFMFACSFPPRDDAFLDAVRHEAETIVRQLRNHPSLAIWCGDNEVDAMFFWGNIIPKYLLPSDNVVTRKTIRDVVLTYDPYRSYVASSPFVSDVIARDRRKDRNTVRNLEMPERHLYPGDETFRAVFRSSRARFLGETGPMFINAMSESPEIVEREMKRVRRLRDIPITRGNYTLERHQLDRHFLTWRDACGKRLRHFFGRDFDLEAWQDFALGVNIICGDIFKFAIEESRSRKWERTGVLWWSLLDMWPMMFNYSVVDYSFRKKKPYYWIRQSQQPLCLMVVETEDGELTLHVANDTLREYHGEFTVTGYAAGDEAGREIGSGEFSAAPNQNAKVQSMPRPDGHMLWIIEWQADGHNCLNHFVCGKAPFDFDVWKQWSARLDELYIDSK